MAIARIWQRLIVNQGYPILISKRTIDGEMIRSWNQMRAMAILYIGPKENPDFETDYYISPILAPEKLLAQFPRVFLEDDCVIDKRILFSGNKEHPRKLGQ
jgi:hypothetical protein